MASKVISSGEMPAEADPRKMRENGKKKTSDGRKVENAGKGKESFSGTGKEMGSSVAHCQNFIACNIILVMTRDKSI